MRPWNWLIYARSRARKESRSGAGVPYARHGRRKNTPVVARAAPAPTTTVHAVTVTTARMGRLGTNDVSSIPAPLTTFVHEPDDDPEEGAEARSEVTDHITSRLGGGHHRVVVLHGVVDGLRDARPRRRTGKTSPLRDTPSVVIFDGCPRYLCS